jgi:hypothetical protein
MSRETAPFPNESDRERRAHTDLHEFLGRHPDAKHRLPELLKVLQAGCATTLDAAWEIAKLPPKTARPKRKW